MEMRDLQNLVSLTYFHNLLKVAVGSCLVSMATCGAAVKALRQKGEHSPSHFFLILR
jgi:hypothetical protein